MQLIKKLFGRQPDPAADGESAQFEDGETGTESGSRNAPRRELVQVVLRDSMRRHGIPSAWIECRIVSVLSRDARTGMHVQLIVRDGVDRLLTYVPAFQSSFMEEIGRFDPRVGDWLLSLSWQFQNLTAAMTTRMPDPAVWAAASAVAAAPARLPAAAVAPSTKQVLPAPTSARSLAPAATLPPPVSRMTADASADRALDAEVLEDLQALYAIRDAALRPNWAAAQGPSGEQDFESTRPGTDQDTSSKSASAPPSHRPW